jgi:hypothetical protein
MLPQLYFFVNIAFSFVAWGIVTARYILPYRASIWMGGSRQSRW